MLNHPDTYLMVLLVDERPEEVTEMKRGISKGEVIASSSDRDTANHIRIAELVVERAKRITEQGRDVFVLLDSLTRLARAYNKTAGSGRTMSGGVDAKAARRAQAAYSARPATSTRAALSPSSARRSSKPAAGWTR